MQDAEGGERVLKTTPQIDNVEVPSAFRPFLHRMSGALLKDQQRPYRLRHARAFNVCLAMADDDPRLAMQYFEALLQGVEEWNAALDDRHTMDFPFP